MKNCSMFHVPCSMKERGITLIEIIVVICIIVLFTMIVISNFPYMLRQFAVSRVTYKLAQDLRRTQDLGLSGMQLSDINGSPIAVKGYGIYVNLINPVKQYQYVIYADVPDASGSSDGKYSGDLSYPLCSAVNQITKGPLRTDCVVEVIDVTKENPSLSIEKITDSVNNSFNYNFVSINFTPPTPITTITTDSSTQPTTAEIFLKNSDGRDRGVLVNSSGLISIQ